MNKSLRKSLGVMGIGLSWGMVWSAVFATIALFIGVVRPEDIDPGEGPVRISGIGWFVGFVSGVIFGMILSFAENRKPIRELALIRVAIWGMLGAAVWPVLTPLPNSMMFLLCPLGAICASASVMIAQRAECRRLEPSHQVGLIGLLFAGPLKAACASNV